MHQIPSLLTRYELDDNEVLAGSLLSIEQYALLQNELVDRLEQLLHMRFDCEQHQLQGRLLEHAALIGRINLIKEMLMRSDLAKSQIAENHNNS